VNSRAKYDNVTLHQDNIETTDAEVVVERTECSSDGQAFTSCAISIV
jgi:hypothetical protein